MKKTIAIALIAALVCCSTAWGQAYGPAARDAAAKKVPLVTFIGAKARPVAGAAVASAGPGDLAGFDRPAVVVAVPDGAGWLTWVGDLPVTATDAQIAEAVKPRATPFYRVGPDGEDALPVGSNDGMDELNAQR